MHTRPLSAAGRVAVLICLATAPALAQRPRAAAAPVAGAPSARELAGISARGRLLAAYQAAAARASDALRSVRPDSARVRQYVARQTAAGWEVRFGRLNAARDTFYEAYLVTPGASDSEVTVQQRAPGRAAPAVDRAAAAAARRAQDTFGATLATMPGAAARPYNTFVIPAEWGEWWVYLLPAQTEAGVYPHGGDVRYRVSADGKRILATRRMHASIDEVRLAHGATEHGHPATTAEVPEDSDVYLVLTRQPLVPELVETPAFDYRVEVDGSIRYVRHLRPGTAGDRAGRS